MKCRFCSFTHDEKTGSILNAIKVLITHSEIEHPSEYKRITDYLTKHDLKQKSYEIELIESTSMYRHARQSALAFAIARKEGQT